MSNSPLVDYTRLSPNYNSMSNKKNEVITIHHVAGITSVESLGALFANRSRQASSNYGIGNDGRIGMYVEEHNRAWTSSNRQNDQRAITIEVSNDSGAPNWTVGEKAMNSLIALCVDICKRNGIKKLNYTGDTSGNLTMHKWFAATGCPGPYLEKKFQWIADTVNAKLLGENIAPEEEKKEESFTVLRRGSQGVEVEQLQENLIFIEMSCGSAGADGIFGMDTENAVREFQGNAGLPVSGVYDEETAEALQKTVSFTKSYSFKDFVKEVQEAVGAVVDGIPGPETLSKTVTVSKKINANHRVVKPLQKRLYGLGYITVGEADGIAGPKFDKATKEFQRDNTRYSDGEFTAQNASWKAILKLK